MNAWDHLPNAKHIDRVIASATMYPFLWARAYDSIEKTDQYWPALVAAENSIVNTGRVPIWDAIWVAVADNRSWSAKTATRLSILPLIAYDDCAYMLDSDPDELEILAALGDFRAVLLQRACFAFNKEKELV